MRFGRVGGACAVVLLVAGCGGPPKSANDGDDTALLAEPPASSAGPASAASGAAKADLARGTKALEAGDLPAAKKAFEAARGADPNDGEAAYYLGVTQEKLGARAAAEANYRDAMRLRPDLDAAALNLSALLADAERWDDAIAVAKAGLANAKDSPGLLLNLAVAAGGKGDAAQATQAFDAAAKKAPNDPMVHLTYGHWLGSVKRNDAAIKELALAHKAAGSDVGVVASVGHELRLVGAFPECTAAFGRALELKDAAELRTERALCRLGAKDEAGALSDLQAAVSKEPKFAPAHFYLGGRLHAQGKNAEAQKAYEQYLQLAPNGSLAKQAQERVDALKAAPKKKK
jgi:Tfp pilus assembly protein PilF